MSLLLSYYTLRSVNGLTPVAAADKVGCPKVADQQYLELSFQQHVSTTIHALLVQLLDETPNVDGYRQSTSRELVEQHPDTVATLLDWLRLSTEIGQ